VSLYDALPYIRLHQANLCNFWESVPSIQIAVNILQAAVVAIRENSPKFDIAANTANIITLSVTDRASGVSIDIDTASAEEAPRVIEVSIAESSPGLVLWAAAEMLFSESAPGLAIELNNPVMVTVSLSESAPDLVVDTLVEQVCYVNLTWKAPSILLNVVSAEGVSSSEQISIRLIEDVPQILNDVKVAAKITLHISASAPEILGVIGCEDSPFVPLKYSRGCGVALSN
jgi:hypothetical protein